MQGGTNTSSMLSGGEKEGSGVMTSRPMKTRVILTRSGEREKRVDQAWRQEVSILLLPTRWTVRWEEGVQEDLRAERQVRGEERREERVLPSGVWSETSGERRESASFILVGSLTLESEIFRF